MNSNSPLLLFKINNLLRLSVGLALLTSSGVDAKELAKTLVKTVGTAQANQDQNVLDIDETGEVVLQKIKVKATSLKAKTEPEDTGYKRYNKTRIVGATRTDTPIKEIPQSVHVVTRKVINDQQTVVVSEALRNVSGVVTNNVLFTPAAEKTRIRGFAAEQLLDGFTQYYNPGDRESTVNLERIEVLKGSNAVLYSGGSGAPVGGVINLVSKLPTPKAFGQFGMKVGSFNFYQPYIDINQSLTNNILFRFTGEFTDSESYIDTIHNERFNINPVLTFTNHKTTTLTLQGRLSRWRQQDYQGLPATGTITGDFRIRPELFIGPGNLPPSRSDFDGVWGTLDHKFNDVWSLNLKARYAESEFDQKSKDLTGADGFRADLPLSPPARWSLVNAKLFQEQTEKSFLSNALAQFNFGQIKNKLLIGADFSEYADAGFIGGEYNGISFVDLRNPYPPFPTQWVQPVFANKGNVQFVTNTTYGGYVQWQSDFYDRLHTLFSLRAGVVEIDYQNKTPGYRGAAKTSTIRMLPRAGVVFDVTKDLSMFVNYSEGMRGQPFTNFVGNPKPALSDSLEGGIKFNFAEKLVGQVAAYRIDRSNVAVGDVSDPAFRSITAGKQRSYGFDIDLTWNPIEGLNILGNFGHTIAKYTDSIDSKFSISSLSYIPEGATLAGVPRNSTRVWVNYDFQQAMLKGLSVGAGVYWQSGAYVSNNNKFKTEPFHTFDASIAYQYQKYKVAVSIKNLTNEDYFQSYGYLDGRVAPSQPVSAYATFSVDY